MDLRGWGQGWFRLKTFFVLIFYFILMIMYYIHFLETAYKLTKSYNTVAKHKNKEVTMKQVEVQNSTSIKEKRTVNRITLMLLI